MDSVYLSNAVQTPPEVPQDVAAGYPTDGSATGGISATVPGAQWYNAITQEICNAIRAANLTPDRNDLTQLARAIRRIATAASPTGAVQFFATLTAPEGWLVCDGRAVSREEYAALFAAIGELYGAGNGSTTFNLPNLIGRFAEGSTSNVGSTVQAGLPNISGKFWAARTGRDDLPGTVANGAFSEAGRWSAQVHNGANDDWGSIYELNASRSSAVYGRSSTVQPPSVRLLPCIKA